MKEILKLTKCPISGLPKITKPEWKYVAKDDSCSLEIALIGNNILYEVPIGIVDGEANKWYVKTASKIIAEYFGDRNYYLAYDYSLLKNASLEAKKLFINWLISNSDQIELVTIFGMNQIMKAAIKIGSCISKKSEKLILTNSYQESINVILKKQNKSADSIGTVIKSNSNFANDKQTLNTRINKLIGYLGKMTWTGNLNQKIPVLPDDDPFAELFAAVAANQDDLREIDKDRAEIYGELKKLISQKEEALKLVSDNELVMLSMLEDVQMQETETKKANEQLEASEEKYRSIVDNMIDGYYRSDKEGNAIFISPSVVKILGFSEDEIIGKNIASFYANPNERSAFLKAIKKTGSVENFPAEFRRKDSDNIFIETNSRIYYDENGDYAGVEGTFHDVTGRIEANKQIRKLSQVVKTTSQSVVITDIKGNIVFVNEALIKTADFDNESEIIGKPMYAFTDGQGVTKLNEEILPNIFDKGFYNGELNFRKKDNTIYPGEINCSIINDEAGKPEFLVAMFSDISERINKEKLISESNKRFKALSEATYEALFISEKGVCIETNRAASKLFGYSYDEIIGIFGTDVIAEESKELVKNNMLAGNEEPYDAIAQRKDGSKFYAQFQGRMFNYAGRNVRITAVRDISSRIEYENLLKQRLDYISFTNKLSTTFISIGSEKLEAAITDLLKVTAKYAGIERGYLFQFSDNKKKLELTHEWCADNVKAHKGILDSINVSDFQDFVATLKKGESIQLHTADLENTPENKTMLDILNLLEIKSFINIPIITDNNLLGYIGFDATKEQTGWTKEMKDSFKLCEIIIANTIERLNSENDLIAAKEKAEESNRLKTAFLNNMSHEIRTPLNGITGFLGLLQDPNLKDEHKQGYIDIINKSSNRLIDTVTDIIEISKIEAGLIEVSIEDVPVNEMLNELYSFFGLEAKNKGLKLIQLPSLSDDASVVLTDNHKLNGILSNLVKNAIKFTEKGSVVFGYNITTDFERGPLIQFFVKDTGIGVPEERQQAIFNRFEQADIEDTRVFEGSGLGLAIAKSYVEMLGGKIWLKTEEGIGTEFMFTIPYKTQKNIAKIVEQQNDSENKQANLKDLTVLIAEDEKVNIQLFEAMFKNTFKQIIYVETGQQAIEAYRDNPKIDLILMDIRMPEMNGYTATREIRKLNKDVFIIAQTAYGLEGDEEKAIEAGCNDYISKPIKRKDLFEIIGKCF